MSALTPGMDTALAADGAIIFGAAQIDFPAYTLRLLDGGGEVPFNGGTFTGADATYGAIGAVELDPDGVGDEAPVLVLTLLPPSDSAAAALSAADMQGSTVRLWIGAIDQTLRTLVPDPYRLYIGMVDQPILVAGKNKVEVDYECVSIFDLLFDEDEGYRLSDANHLRIWPNEKGLENMSGLVRKIYWGVAAPSGAGSSAGAASGGGAAGGMATWHLANRE